MDDIDSKIMRLKSAFGVRTHAELADKLGVSTHTVSVWKRRKLIPERILLKCGQMTNTPILWLETGTPSVPFGEDGEYTDDQLINEPLKKYGSKNDLPADIVNIVEILKEFDTKQRRDVMRCVLEIEGQDKG